MEFYYIIYAVVWCVALCVNIQSPKTVSQINILYGASLLQQTQLLDIVTCLFSVSHHMLEGDVIYELARVLCITQDTKNESKFLHGNATKCTIIIIKYYAFFFFELGYKKSFPFFQ